MGHPFMVGTLITLVPKTRSTHGVEAPVWQHGQANTLVRSALEPSGSGAYVEAVREWIERVTPRGQARASLRLVR